MAPPSPYLFQTGLGVVSAVLMVTVVASLLTLIACTFFLWRYRKKIARLMSAECGSVGHRFDSQAQLPLGSSTLPRDSDRPLVSSRTNQLANRLFGQMISRPVWQACQYAFAGLLFALVLALATVVAFSRPGVNYLRAARHPLQFLFLFWTFLWPILLTTNIVAPGTRRSRRLRVLVYFVVLAVVGGLLAWTATETPVRTDSLNIPAWSGETPTRIVIKWTAFNIPATLLILAFRNRRVRAVAPLVLGFMTVLSTGVISIIAAAFIYPDLSVSVLAWASGTLNVSVRAAFIGYFIVLTVGACLLFGALGWGLDVWIRRSYRRKATSDQSLAVDALLAVFVSLYAMILAPAGPGWSVFALVAFVILKLVLSAGNKWLRSRRPSRDYEPALLVLRVFALGRRSEVLFDAVARHWRHLGHVRLIAGTDLALSTIAPHQFLAFVSGTLEQLFISSESAIENAVAGLDNRRDYDGRFRINDFFCYSDTWQLMVQSLIRTTDVVLMDLRSLTKDNAGCAFEIKELFNAMPLEQLVFVTDDRTDKTFLNATLQQACRELRSGSPNTGLSLSTFEPFELKSANDHEIKGLLRHICTAAARSQAAVSY